MTLRASRVSLGLLAAILAIGCAGLFTGVPLPRVSSSEERAVLESTAPLSLDQLDHIFRRNFYSILYDEVGGAGESRESFISRQLTEERVPPTWLLSIGRDEIAQVSQTHGSYVGAQLEERAWRVQAPLVQRLNRVGSRVAAAAGRADLVFEIGPPGWFNAGALHGFDSRHIVVGPKVILLAESEDGLAWLLGHEVAHITNHHTTIGAVQDLLVGTLEFTSKVALAVANAAACTQGSCMTGQELRDSMAGAATITGAVARGAINATGLDRDQEREADYYGLQYAVRAGYRPEAAVTVTRQMLAYEQGAGSSFEIPFLRDHPTWPERVVRVEKWVRAMGAGGVQTAGVSRIPAESTTAPAPVSAAPSAGRGATSAAAAPQVIRPPSTCWQVGGADGQRCTTCCDEAGCRSRCEQGSRPTQVAASARPRSCWNVDSRIGGKAAVCTTCCTASVSCSTTCARPN